MKSIFTQTTRRFAWATLVIGAMTTLETSWAADPAASKPAPAPVPARSIFIMPTSPKEGHDPFFPQSTRPYGTSTVPAPKVEWTALKLVGISGSAEHRLVIINNNTFAEGDEQDVPVEGSRIHVRCLKISTNSVTLMVGGQTRELSFSTIK